VPVSSQNVTRSYAFPLMFYVPNIAQKKPKSSDILGLNKGTRLRKKATECTQSAVVNLNSDHTFMMNVI
jgi:hypothetical protein